MGALQSSPEYQKNKIKEYLPVAKRMARHLTLRPDDLAICCPSATTKGTLFACEMGSWGCKTTVDVPGGESLAVM